MTITRGKTIPYVDDTITKEVMANVNATSFGVQFIRMPASTYIKRKHIAPVHVHKSKQDFISKHEVET
jgi:hypothetical protein